MAVASAGPYASPHLAPDRQPRQHPTTQFFTGQMPFLPPNQQRQSTEGMFTVSRLPVSLLRLVHTHIHSFNGHFRDYLSEPVPEW